MTVGILTWGIILFILVIVLFPLDTPFANKDSQKPIVTAEETQLNKISGKIHEKYAGVDVKLNSNNELLLQVVADEEYFSSVINDLHSIVSTVNKDSVLKDYQVVFERFDWIGNMDEVYSEGFQLVHILESGLKEYEVIDHISTDSQQASITLYTSIKGSDNYALKKAIEIKQQAIAILNSEELNLQANLGSYKIKIMNSEGIEING